MSDWAYIDTENLLGIVRRACNYVDPRLMDHGYRVAGIVWKILMAKGGYGPREIRDICFLALLHDVGAYKTDEISRLVQFETENAENHAIYGYLFIRYFSPFADMAPCILHHHTPWRTLEQVEGMSARQKEIAQIIFLADRIDIGAFYERCGWDGCVERIQSLKGYLFQPELADLVLDPGFSVTREELSWDYEGGWKQVMNRPYSAQEINDCMMMLVYTIDFRSRHTVTHTITTTCVSWEIACLMGLDETYRHQIACGAILHDAGKIGVPVEILEYPGRPSPQAMTVMRTHVDMTEAIFGGEVDETVARIALRHHEKLDGSGYWGGGPHRGRAPGGGGGHRQRAQRNQKLQGGLLQGPGDPHPGGHEGPGIDRRGDCGRVCGALRPGDGTDPAGVPAADREVPEDSGGVPGDVREADQGLGVAA